MKISDYAFSILRFVIYSMDIKNKVQVGKDQEKAQSEKVCIYGNFYFGFFVLLSQQ